MTLLVTGDLVAGLVVVLVGPLGPRHLLLLVGAGLAFRAAAGVYRARLRLSYLDDVPRGLVVVVASLALTLALEALVLDIEPPTRALLEATAILLVVGEAVRAVVLLAVRYGRCHLDRGERTLVIGDDELAGELFRVMVRHPEFGLRPVQRLEEPSDPDGVSVTRMSRAMAAAISRHRVTTVLLASSVSESTAFELATQADRLGCAVLALPRNFELYGEGREIERLRSFPLIRLVPDPTRRPSWRVKCTLDRLVAAAALVALLPLFVVAAALVWLDTGRPIIYSQERVGLGGRRFRLHKFRSLRTSEDEAATRWTIDHDDRVSGIGRLLRRTSIDELPQMWNILRGEMSLVGPRPERPVFVEKFSAAHGFYAARSRVAPGLTGLAQVNGLRGDTSISDRARYDNYYIASWSLWLDARIVVRTTGELLRHVRP